MIDVLATRYHKDSGFPAGIVMPTANMDLVYSKHSRDKALERLGRAVDKNLLQLLPSRLPSTFDVIEVTTFADVPIYWLVRFPLTQVAFDNATRIASVHRTDYDVVLALGTGMTKPLTVRTVYLNHKDDHHATLRTGRYQVVKA